MPSLVRTAASRSRRGLAFLCLSLASYGVPAPAAAAGGPMEVATPVEDAAAKGQVSERPAVPVEVPAGLRYAGPPSEAQGYAGEVEPNGTSATATPLAGTNVVVRANLFPNGDIDFYSFTATAGDRIYAATMTGFSAGSSTDSQLTLLASDGTTVDRVRRRQRQLRRPVLVDRRRHDPRPPGPTS